MAHAIHYDEIYKKLTTLLKNYEAQLNKDLFVIVYWFSVNRTNAWLQIETTGLFNKIAIAA